MRRLVIRGAACAMLLPGVVLPVGPPSSPRAVAENAVVGTISGYDAATRVLSVEVGRELQSFVVDQKASVHVGSRIVSASELGSYRGRKVKIRFIESGGKRLAQTVMVSRTP
jgi:hypothetical protein